MFRLIAWWYSHSFTNQPDGLNTAWDTYKTRGGWATLLAKKLKGRGYVLVWKVGREACVGVLYRGWVYQPDESRMLLADLVQQATEDPQTVLYARISLSDRTGRSGRTDFLFASMKQCRYYINKVRA